MNINNFKEKAEFLKSIAHPTRLTILHELLKSKKCVTKIESVVKARQPNISQHLAVLKATGVVDYKSEGKQKCYFLCNPEKIKNLFSQLGIK